MMLQGIYVVTVTYGDRFHHLKQVVDAVLQNHIRRIVVVDNASKSEAIGALEHRSAGRTVLIRHSENMGSATGYRAGLEYAFRCEDCEYIWLLDDDNLPDPDSLTVLCKHYNELSRCSKDDFALMSLRRDREYLRRVAEGQPLNSAYPPHSGFLGFHVKDIFRKVRRHAFPSSRHGGNANSRFIEQVRVPYGPYGGLFFHKCILNKVGYPDDRFYLYGDDTEFTWRFASAGVNIYLIPSSMIGDLEESWHIKEKGSTSFWRYLSADSDSRVYYSIRNQVYFEKNRWTDNRLTYFINRCIYLSVLFVFSMFLRKGNRFSLIRRAIRDGYDGNLGRIDQMGLR